MPKFLPIIGGSFDSWGDELNAYLNYDHESSGGHKPNVAYHYPPTDGGVVDGNVVFWDTTSATFKKAISDGTLSGRDSIIGLYEATPSLDRTAVVFYGTADTTAAIAAGTEYYISDSVAGEFTSSKPVANAISLGVGTVMDTSSKVFINVDRSVNVENLKVNLIATTDPTTGDDTGDGYAVGSRWINVTSDEEFVCLDATAAAAVWATTTAAGGGTTNMNHYLRKYNASDLSLSIPVDTPVNFVTTSFDSTNIVASGLGWGLASAIPGGYYEIYVQATFNSGTSNNVKLGLVKAGAATQWYEEKYLVSTAPDFALQINDIVYLDDTSSNVEVHALAASSSTVLAGDTSSYFTIKGPIG